MRYVIALLFVLTTTLSFAQKLTISGECSNNSPEVGEEIEVTYKIESSSDISNAKLVPPSVPNLKYRNDGRSSGMESSWINGRSSVKYTISYSIAYNTIKPGEVTIPPLTISVDGVNYKSNSIVLVVKAADPNKSVRSEEYYFDLDINKKSVYVGEPLSLTIKYYSQYNVSNLQMDAEPTLNGFYKKDIAVANKQSIKVINGKQHVTGSIKQYLLIPIESGNRSISKISGNILLLTQGFGFFSQTVQKKIYSNAISIQVKPLPENGKPASFSGGVGKFSISSKIDKTKVKTNDALAFTLTVKGTGNIKMTEVPKVIFPDDFEVYDPKITENINADISGMSGLKTYEYILIPKNAGTKKIPSLEFSYFNPSTQHYETTSTKETVVEVEQGDGSASTYVPTNKQELKFANKDIHYFLVNESSLEKNNDDDFLGSALFWVLVCGAPSLVIAVFVLTRKKEHSSSEMVSSKNKKAAKNAEKQLKEAHKKLVDKDSKAFYGEVLKALNNYFSDKFNIQKAQLNNEIIAEELRKKGLSENDIKDTLHIIEKCQMAQYAPTNESIENVYAAALAQITKIEL